ncbi:adenylate/guanylate cyclase domain-containing protein [Pantanalinema rosaneae CENA516]|uniref:adenylate/guanylate cyclase domain-containing protein n=1 Tax=Pantanalinema rosaneae TaxID=1620701 RepID=UPI003D6E4A03
MMSDRTSAPILSQAKHRTIRWLGKVPLHLVLVVPFILQIMAAVGIVGWLSFTNGQRAVNQVASQLRTENGNRIRQHLDEYLATPIQINRLNADAVDLGLLDLNNFSRIGQYFWRQMQTLDVGYISFGNPRGDFIGVERLNTGGLLINERSAATNNRLFAYTTDNRGNRQQIKGIVPDYNPLSEGWYIDAVKAGKPAWSSIYQWDDKPEILSISANYPLYDRNRQLLGVLSVDHILSQISNFLQNIKVSPNGATFILERSGELVATSSLQEKPYRLLNGKAARVKAINSNDPLIRETITYLKQHFGSLEQIGNSEQLDFFLHDQRQFLQVMPWRDRWGIDWLIVVVVPESDFMAQINQNTSNTLYACVIALVVAILVGFITSRWITRQILRLSQASEALANGELDQAVQSRGIAELETLAKAFNRMAQQLRESFETLAKTNEILEQRVTERTASLVAAEAELRTLFTAMTDLVIVYDRDGRCQKIVSSESTQLIRPTQEQIGKTVHELLPPAQADQNLACIRQALETHQVVSVEYCLPIAGAERWFSANVSPLTPETVVWVARDISDRKLAESGLRQNEQRLRKQNQVLLDLAKSTVLNQGDLKIALQEVTEAATRTLEVDRAAVWFYDRGAARLRCLDLYERSTEQHSEGTELMATDFPAYFRALDEAFAISADDALQDSRTSEFAEHYLNPYGITSLLDTPVRSGGKTVGVLCLERLTAHRWTLEEQSFARSMADLVALGIEARERKRAEEALQATNAELRALLMAMDDLIYVFDRHGRCLRIPSSHPRLLLQPIEAQLNKTLPELYPAELATKFLRCIHQALDRDETVKVEYSLMIDGQEVWADANISAIDAHSVVWAARDVTDRKQAEAALQEKEQYLRLILNNIPQQVFWKDTNLVFLGCNENWAKAAGFQNTEEIIGKTDYDLLPNPDIAEQFRTQDRRIIETDIPQLHLTASKVKSAPDGQTIWLDISKIPIHDLQGRVIGILGVIEDITQRKQAEEALKAEQDKSERLLLNILPNPIVERLKQNEGLFDQSSGEALIADSFDEVTVLFADIVNFTTLSADISPADLVGLLNRIFLVFDDLCERHQLEKIKTIGDAYMVVGGLPNPRPDHAEAIAEMALDMQAAIQHFRTYEGKQIAVRVGINTGAVVAGVIGKKKFIYDLWGDAVNMASRMEAHGLAGAIQVTEATYQRLKTKYRFDHRGTIEVKGKGEMTTYWLIDRQPG